MRVALADGWIDTERHQVEREGRASDVLTAQEAGLVDYLAHAEGRAVSRDELLVMVWRYSPRSVTRAVDKAVNRLRSKIEVNPRRPVHLLTVRGEGYRFVPAAPERPSGLVEVIVEAIASDPTWVLRNREIAQAALSSAGTEAGVRIAVELCDAFSLRIDDVGAERLLDEVSGPAWDALFVRQHLTPILAHGEKTLSAIAKRSKSGSTLALAARRMAGIANAEGRDDDALMWLENAHAVATRSGSLHVQLNGRFPLVAKVADVDPGRARALLEDTLTLASERHHWTSAALASGLLGSIALDMGDLVEAEVTLGRALSAVERVGNERVLFYLAARHDLARLLLGMDASPVPWAAKALGRGSMYGLAFLRHAAGCRAAMAGDHGAALAAWDEGVALGVPFASEAIGLDRAFEAVRRGAPWAVEVTSEQGRRARDVLEALARDGASVGVLDAAWPAVPHAMLWRWRQVLE